MAEQRPVLPLSKNDVANYGYGVFSIEFKTSSMNAALSTQLAIPEGLPDILKELTREILRDQPENIHAYAANYFERMLAQQYGGGGGGGQGRPIEGGRAEIDIASLEARISEMFTAADAEGKGYLTRAQATSVVGNVAGELSFTDAQIQYIMTEADENQDGMM